MQRNITLKLDKALLKKAKAIGQICNMILN